MSEEIQHSDALRKKELGELVLRNAEQFTFPPTEWEANTLTAILAPPRVTVKRPPEDELLAAGMLPYQCHSNCATQAANDPDRLSRHVWGWLIERSDLILHSVIEMDGRWLCLTPQLVPATASFQFIPDPFIAWEETNDGFAKDAFRDGVKLSGALRTYPELHLRMWEKFQHLMDSGMSAYDAREIVDATLGSEYRNMAPL